MSVSASAQDIPEKPHQPSGSTYRFPKRTFGQKKPVARAFQAGWFAQWPWLHYSEAKDVAYCHTCLVAFHQKKMIKHNADPAFVSITGTIILLLTKQYEHMQVTKGFSNWKDATISFRNHQASACHREAVEVVITIPSTTQDIGEQLSHQHAAQKQQSRHALHQILTCVRFLGRQGLALRGDGDESDGNFKSLLQMKANDDPILAEWLKRKENVYTSPEIQNEIIKLMGLQVLRSVTADLQASPFLTVMADETTDCSNHEQVTLVLRSITQELEVNEEFLGLYQVASIDAAMLTTAIKDVLVRCNLPFDKLRGQCYDGASAMSSPKSGVAKRIADLEPRAVFTHCYGHTLNLAAADTLKQCKLMREALETTREITKLIKYSPRRDGIFQRLKETLPSGSTVGIRILCPTRWTVRAESIKSILANYDVLKMTWDEALEATKDTETKARIRGVAAQMSTFTYLFGSMLGELVLKHTDNLSRTLQHTSLSAAEAQQITSMTVATLKSMRSDDQYDRFWDLANLKSEELGVNDPQLPRQRKIPRRFDDGSSAGHFPTTPKDHFKSVYFEAIDLIVNCIQNRFDQPGYRIYQSLETLLVKACKQEELQEHLDKVCDFYHDDFDKEMLHCQLQTFGVHFQTVEEQVAHITIFDVKRYFLALSPGQASLLSQVRRLLQLILIMPATNATSERSFSALRRLKNYLRSTMAQERLNHLMIMHVHKERTDKLDLKCVLNEFVCGSEHRSGIFAKY